MPVTKSRSAATQLTATGTGTTLSLSTSYGHSLYYRHVNGTGTITTQGSAVLECRTSGGTTWFTLTTLQFGTTASEAREAIIPLPDDANEVRLDYTAPVGSTGHTLDYEVGTITGV